MKTSKAIQGHWLEKKLSFSPLTTTGYEVSFKWLVEFLNDAELNTITSSDIGRVDAASNQRVAKCPQSGHKNALIWTAHAGYCNLKWINYPVTYCYAKRSAYLMRYAFGTSNSL